MNLDTSLVADVSFQVKKQTYILKSQNPSGDLFCSTKLRSITKKKEKAFTCMNKLHCSDRLFQCHSGNSQRLRSFSATVTHSIFISMGKKTHQPQDNFNMYPLHMH